MADSADGSQLPNERFPASFRTRNAVFLAVWRFGRRLPLFFGSPAERPHLNNTRFLACGDRTRTDAPALGPGRFDHAGRAEAVRKQMRRLPDADKTGLLGPCIKAPETAGNDAGFAVLFRGGSPAVRSNTGGRRGSGKTA